MENGRGMILYPKEIQREIEAMNYNLESLLEYAEKEKSVLREAADSRRQLMGVAWDGILSYIEQVQLPLMEVFLQWISCRREANLKYRAEAQKLPQIQLDWVQLEEQLHYWRWRLEDERAEEHPSYSAIRMCHEMIRNVESKLEAMKSFARDTWNIYDHSLEILSVLNRAGGELGKVLYHPKEHSIDFKEVSADWILELQLKSSYEYLFSQGFSREELKKLDDMGFRPSEVRIVVENVGTEPDRELITGLLKGDYQAAFHGDSAKLGPKAQVFLAEYLLRLSMKEDSESELERALNSMLKPEEETDYFITKYYRSNRKAISYLKTLCAGTLDLLDKESKLMLYCRDELKEGLYGELVERNEKLMAMATMCGSQYELLTNTLEYGGDSNSVIDLSSIKISAMQYSEVRNAYDYQLDYFGERTYFETKVPFPGGNVKGQMTVQTAILESPDQVEKKLMGDAFWELQQERQDLELKLLVNLAGGGSLTYLSAVSPMAGSIVAAIGGLIEGDTGKTYAGGAKAIRASELMNQEIVRRVFSSENVMIPAKLLSAVEKYNKESKKLEKKLEKSREETQLSWFGEAGTYRVDGKRSQVVVAGIYNPEVIEKLRVWEEGGLEALIRDAGKTPVVIKTRDKDIFIGTLTPEEKILWEGGDILGMEIDKMNDATESLLEKYQLHAPEMKDLSILLSPGE